MIQILISIMFGAIPEVLYFTLFLIAAKDLKDKKVRLFFLIFIAYLLCVIVNRYKTIYYVSFIALIYIILKILYKGRTQIIDVFVISISLMYLIILSIVCFAFAKNIYLYYIMLVINRILLFIPFIFKSNIRKSYINYCRLWNRSKDKNRPIKSITLRNISLISLNIFIFICNGVCLYIINSIKE